MKKYTIKSILILAIGCMLHSCLDLDPKDQIADGNYWQTATDFKLFSNQFYGWTRDFKNSVYDAPHSDKRSDLIMDKGSKMYLLTEPTAYRLPTATTPMLTIASVVQISSYRKQRVLQIRVTSHNISVKPSFSALTATLTCYSFLEMS